MKRVIFFSILLFIICVVSFSYANLIWHRTFGGSESDKGYFLEPTSDGGFVIIGYTNSFGAGQSDIWLIKTNSEGEEMWNRTYGGEDGDLAYVVHETTDGGFIIAGAKFLWWAGGWDFWLIKTDANGNEQWNQTYGGWLPEVISAVKQTSDGGYILTGYTTSYGAGGQDLWLLKTDPEGNEEWNKTFDGPSLDYGRDVQQTTDGGYIITGGPGVWLIKTDEYGNWQWDKLFGGGYGVSVQQTTDGGYIITGSTYQYVWLIKTDASGNLQWDKTFGGPAGDYGYSVQQTTDGGYIITGETESFGAGQFDVWLLKTDENGELLWDKTFGGTSGDHGTSVQQTTDGSYIITGYTNSYGAGNYDVWLIYYDPECQVNIFEDSLDLSYPGGASCYPTEADLNVTQDGCSGTIQWESSNEAVATVDNTGHVTAVGLGSCIITAYCSTQTDCKDECPVTVVPCSSSEHGEGGTEDDEGYCVTQTSDGGYIVTGYTASYGDGSKDIWLIKYNEWFTKEWDKTFGGAYDDAGWFVIQSGDGGYVLCGDDTVDPLGEIIQCVGLKLDYNGNMWRTLTYGGSSGWNGGRCVRPIYTNLHSR